MANQARKLEFVESKSNVTKQSGTGPSTKDYKVPFSGYVHCEIGRSEKESFREWERTIEDSKILEIICKLADDDYKVSIGSKGQDMMAAITNMRSKDGMFGYVLTAFGGHAREALLAVIYKHDVKLQGDWGDEASDDDWSVR